MDIFATALTAIVHRGKGQVPIRVPLVHVADHVDPQATGRQRTSAQPSLVKPITRVELETGAFHFEQPPSIGLQNRVLHSSQRSTCCRSQRA
jgi:hypothetical protein